MKKYHVFLCVALLTIIIAFALLAYQVGFDKDISHNKKMYPSILSNQNKIDKIDIRFPSRLVSMERENDAWLLKTSDNFPVNEQVLQKLYQFIASIELVSRKTQKKENFSRLNLLNPSLYKNIKGEGTRFTLYTGRDQTMYDFIIGTSLQSYKNLLNPRIFVRYGMKGGAYLAKSNRDYQYSPSDFYSNNLGMPKYDDIVSVNLQMGTRTLLELKRSNDPLNAKKTIFLPPTIPVDKKLIYPFIFNDYLKGLTQQLKPFDAMTIPKGKAISDVLMTMNLTKNRVAQIQFWYSEDHHFIRIIRNDIEGIHDYYIYRIHKKDYDSFIQPLDAFLKTQRY